MTAAHCLQNNWGNLKHDLIKVSDYDNVYVTDAVPVAIDRDLDVGFIKGNFQDFQTVPVDFTGQHFKDGMLMVSCGFPSGQWQPLCVQLKHVGNHYFQYATTGGPIYHGCSGGPVFEVTSGYIVGVNSAVDEDIVVISPVINALINVGL